MQSSQNTAGPAGDGPLSLMVGGRRRLEVILLLGGVLALDGADKATVGAIAPQLKDALAIGNVKIGLLVTVSTAVGAIATLPIGALVDRIHRVRLLAVAMLIWSLAMIIGGFAASYSMLLISRLALGIVVAAAAPAVASLTGDFFPSFERGRIWGFLLGGELLGSAFGLMVSGLVAGWVSWRAAFWVLGVIGAVLALVFAWRIREPARGGLASLPPSESSQIQDDGPSITEAVDEAEEATPTINPKEQPDPAMFSFLEALRYIFSVRTNVLLIIASALGYFFFTGLRSFGVVFMSGRFGLDQSMASFATVSLGMGSIVGTLIAGWLADRLIARRYLAARVMVPAVAFILCAVFLIPGALATTLWITAPVFFLSAASLGATNPPLDAARMDIIHSHVWGRAESVRTSLRYLFEAAAPLAFGYLSTVLGSASGAISAAHKAQSGATGLAYTLVVMSSTLVAAGVILFVARRSYPKDVADALARQRATESAQA